MRFRDRAFMSRNSTPSTSRAVRCPIVARLMERSSAGKLRQPQQGRQLTLAVHGRQARLRLCYGRLAAVRCAGCQGRLHRGSMAPPAQELICSPL